MNAAAPKPPKPAAVTPIVELRQATKKYGGVPAIDLVDFALLPGEIHTICGENGAGKSTLTKVLAGVVTLTSGRMLIEGREVNPRTPNEALHLGVAMVFQETSLVPTMTVAQNPLPRPGALLQPTARHIHRRSAVPAVVAVRRRSDNAGWPARFRKEADGGDCPGSAAQRQGDYFRRAHRQPDAGGEEIFFRSGVQPESSRRFVDLHLACAGRGAACVRPHHNPARR